MAYDEEAFNFLKLFRDNLSKPFKKIEPAKQITAKTFMIINCDNLTPLYGKDTQTPIEIASISKVMTCYLAIMVCTKYNLNIYRHTVRVGEKAAETPGTTAELQPGDILTLYELLLGMMLPSGNDASVAIAEAMGKVIQKHKKKETKKSYYETFIAHMNLLSKEL